MTTGQVLLSKNEANIQDEDQVEIMKEVLHYIEAPAQGVSGYHLMKSGGKYSPTITSDSAESSQSITDQKTCDLTYTSTFIRYPFIGEQDQFTLDTRSVGP